MRDWPAWLRIALGWLCLAIGALGLVLPFVPGVLLLAIGAVLLSSHSRPFRRLSAWVHARYPNLRGALRRFRARRRRRRYIPADARPPAENDLAKSMPREQAGKEERTSGQRPT